MPPHYCDALTPHAYTPVINRINVSPTHSKARKRTRRCSTHAAGPNGFTNDGNDSGWSHNAKPCTSDKKHTQLHSLPHPNPSQQFQCPLTYDWRAFRANLVSKEIASYHTEPDNPHTLPSLQPTLPSESTCDTQNPESRSSAPACSSGTWAHRIAGPEAGCLLIATHRNLGFFNRSVILLLEHDEIAGSLGLVLNRQAALQIADLHVQQDLKSTLGSQALHLGGPLNYNTIHLLHGQSDVQDSLPVCPGLFTGGLASALRLVQDGLLKQDDFCVLAGYTGWQPGQLSAEADAWMFVSASPSTTLSLTLGRGGCVSQMWEQLLQIIDLPL